MTILALMWIAACSGECVPGYFLHEKGLVEPLVERCWASTDGTLCFAAALAEEDSLTAAGLLERGCTLGERRACSELVERFSSGFAGVRDLTYAVRMLEERCADDARSAPCDALASRPLWNVPQIAAARRDCAGHNPNACLALGHTFAGASGQTVSEADRRTAESALQIACAAAIPAGCLALGELMMDGRGLGKDLDRARSAFAAACDEGSDDACALHEELDLPLKGCENGDGSSCAKLARVLVSAPLHRSDRERALAYWERACELDPVRCAEAGDQLRFGELGPDLPGAVAFLRRSDARDLPKRFDQAQNGCQNRIADACWKLGDMFYGDGELVLQPRRAQVHYRQGCDLGSSTACDRLKTRFKVLQANNTSELAGAQ